MSKLSYTELLSSLDEFEGTVLDGMTLPFAVGWFRSLANIMAFISTIPDINDGTTVVELRQYLVETLEKANELPDKQDLVN